MNCIRKWQLGCVVLVFSLSAAQAAVRIAIWPADPSLAGVTDLLTTDLSRESDISLLERAELDLIIREQSLSAEAARRDPLQLGSLVGAQGVVFLSRDGDEVVVQVVAVQPGVIIGFYTYPFRENDMEWVSLLALQIIQEISRLSVSRGDALSVSVSSVRSSFSDSASLKMERDLKKLLISRLAAEPRVFVLDRERMRVLAEEKSIDLYANEQFWKSGIIIEGLINPVGVTEGKTELVLTVNRNGGGSTSFTVVRKTDDLEGLINTAVESVVPELLGQESIVDWRPRHEAAVFLEEAQWAHQWKLFPRMQEALESAWALGLQSQECGLLRAQSYLEAAFSRRGRADAAYPHRVISLPQPSLDRIQNALMGLDSLEEFIHRFPLQGRGEGTEWIPVAISGLETASIVLKMIYANRPAVESEEWYHSVPLLRLRCRQTADLIEKALRQAETDKVQHYTKEYNHNYHVDVSSLEWLDNVWLLYGGLWYDDPQEAAGRLQEILRRWAPRKEGESPVRLDQAIFKRTTRMPWLANWAGMPEEDFARIQLDAIRRLSIPEFPRTSMYSAYLELRFVTETEDVVAAARRMLKALVENDGWAHNQLFEFELPLIFFELLDQKWPPLTVAKKQAKEELALEFSRTLLPIYIANSSRAYPELLDQLVVPGAFEPLELPDIEKDWHSFVKRSKLSSQCALRHAKILGLSAAHVTERTPSPVQEASVQTPAHAAAHSSALAVKQFRTFEVLDPITDRTYPLELAGMHVDGDVIWLEGVYRVEMVGVRPREEHVLLGVDLLRPGHRIVHLPTAPILPAVLSVGRGEAYLRHDDQVQFIRLEGEMRPEAIPFPLTRDLKLWSLDRGLFAFADGAILRYDKETGQTEILASSRRRPAQNILDDRSPYQVHAMIDGPRGTVRALIDQSFYEYDLGGKTWVELGKARTMGGICQNANGILCYPDSHMHADFTFLDSISARPVALFRTRDRNGQWQDEDASHSLPEEFPYTPGIAAGLSDNRMAAFDSQSIWFLDGPYLAGKEQADNGTGGGGRVPVRKMEDRDGTLWRFCRADGEYAQIPIEYAADRRKPMSWSHGLGRRISRWDGPHRWVDPGPYSRMLATVDGLAVLEPEGIWWLPRSDIDAYVFDPSEAEGTKPHVSDSHPAGSLPRSRHEGVYPGPPMPGRVSLPHAQPVRPGREDTVLSAPMSLAWKALAQGQAATLKRILDAEGDPDRRDDKGTTMLMHAALDAGPSMVEILLAAGADAKATDPDGKSVLCYAAEGGSARVLSMVIDRSGGIQAETDGGSRALLSAVKSGKPGAVRILLEAGAQISAENGDSGAEMMHHAICRNSPEIVELLLDHGADVNAPTMQERTPLIHAAGAQYPSVRIIELLLDRGADVAAKDVFGVSAVQKAVNSGSIAIVQLLLDNGADVKELDRFGNSLLHCAISRRKFDLVPFLLDCGVAPDVIGFMGLTPLHIAVQVGDVATVRILLQKNANRDIKDDRGETPVDIATKKGEQEILNLFSEFREPVQESVSANE